MARRASPPASTDPVSERSDRARAASSPPVTSAETVNALADARNRSRPSQAEPTRISTARITGPASIGTCSSPPRNATSFAPLASTRSRSPITSLPPRRVASLRTTTVAGSSCTRGCFLSPEADISSAVSFMNRCRVRALETPSRSSASRPAPVGATVSTCQPACSCSAAASTATRALPLPASPRMSRSRPGAMACSSATRCRRRHLLLQSRFQ